MFLAAGGREVGVLKRKASRGRRGKTAAYGEGRAVTKTLPGLEPKLYTDGSLPCYQWLGERGER